MKIQIFKYFLNNSFIIWTSAVSWALSKKFLRKNAPKCMFGLNCNVVEHANELCILKKSTLLVRTGKVKDNVVNGSYFFKVKVNGSHFFT